VLSSCAASSEFTSSVFAQSTTSAPQPAAADSTARGESNGDNQKTQTRPTTLPEALVDYFCRLHSGCATAATADGASANPSGGATQPYKGQVNSTAGTTNQNTVLTGAAAGPTGPNKGLFNTDDTPDFTASFAPSPVGNSLLSDGVPPTLSSGPSTPGNDAATGTKNQSSQAGPNLSGQVDTTGTGKNPAELQTKAPGLSGAVETNSEAPSWLSVHGQATVVDQIHDHFQAPYTGPNSLLRVEPSALSETTTLFLDARVWEGGELIFNPELGGGFGFSGVTGIADFPNGEITRVGKPQPTPYVARLLLRQTWGLGGEQETVEDGANQLAGKRDIDRITFVIGKMTFTDVVDNNTYSHDPRTQLMGWAMMFNGAWDYPGDTRGYDYGMAIDFNHKYWALRWGIFGEPNSANGPVIDDHVLRANGQVLEWEGRWKLNGHNGAIRLMSYLNLADMGNYRQAVAEMPVDPNVDLTRAWRIKYGFGANLEQEITKDVGFWARLGWNDGHTETWAFTPIDETLSFGLLVKGTHWRRPDDEVGLGFALDGISGAHREYLRAGGLEYMIGDGKLNYAPEEVLETYYSLQFSKAITFSGDFQFVNDPGYNEDRGPVYIASLRVHFEY